MPVTGHPALALIATVRQRKTDDSIDDLADSTALRAWLNDLGFAVTTCESTALDDVRALREAIFELVEAAAQSRRPRRAALTAVNAVASRPVKASRLRWDVCHGFQTVEGGASVAAALTVIASHTIDLLTGPDRQRLHQCEADSCGTLFLTSTSGRPRRWCASATCGNRERVQAHRDRRKPSGLKSSTSS